MKKEEAIQFFSELYGGEHKLPNEVEPCGLGWQIKDHRSSFSTFDGNKLTRLVLMAHEKCIRVDIQPDNNGIMEIAIWKRKKDGAIDQRHPTIEEAIKSFRGE